MHSFLWQTYKHAYMFAWETNRSQCILRKQCLNKLEFFGKYKKQKNFQRGGSWVLDPQQCMNDNKNIRASANFVELHCSDKSYSAKLGSFLREPYTLGYYEQLNKFMYLLYMNIYKINKITKSQSGEVKIHSLSVRWHLLNSYKIFWTFYHKCIFSFALDNCWIKKSPPL